MGEEARAARRAAERRRIRRQRVIAAAALATIALVVVVLVLLGSAGGSGESGDRAGPRAQGGVRPKPKGNLEPASSKVRNATTQPGWKPYSGPVPILEYHVLGRPHGEVPYPQLYVGRSAFSKQMDWLEQQGYEAVTLEQVESAWYEDGRLPAKPVVISFDDGYRPQFTFALPELRKHGWPGVLNLKAEGSELYESNVRAMLAAGWELAAHTIHHSDLTTLEGAALEEEVAGSRRILRREYHVPVANFCYPAGQYDAATIDAVKKAGYTGATTEIPGYATSSSPYELARMEVLGDWGVQGLAAALRSGAAEAGPPVAGG
ncbi:MAG TPA: polysaccharide deacetylase family protein [Solirubrobacterales bacterium]|nr:polysaccharide deacetylase family protein [Solirubrobacterales bacterium]